MRGDVFALKPPRTAKGHEQDGARFAVVIQSDHLLLSTWLVAPTSASAQPTTFRPEVLVRNRSTRVLTEQARAIDPGRLGAKIGSLTHNELRSVDAALRLVLAL
ncbi:MAG TPA: type II toxin-antitoxin system PemK/MazF family toxin [Nonomuraea sp.]|nr:type II toxin-antitoxin system PemK/MazF family toxin [Nonomuraea sp.]